MRHIRYSSTHPAILPQAPAISVILPIHNGSAYLRESVESVLAQDTDDYELIVCDDASSDDTWTLLQQYSAKCRLLRNEAKLGLFPTLNRLMSEARASWVHLWSHDDRMLPNCLSGTLAFANAHPDVGMIYSRTYFIDENGRRDPSPWKDDPTPEIVDSELAAKIMFYFSSIAGNIANVTLRKDVFDSLGGFREDMKLSGDYEFWARLSEAHPIGHQRDRLIELRVHDAQFSKQSQSGEKFIRENIEIRDRLLGRIPEPERETARHFQRWVIDSNNFHFALKAAITGEWRTASNILSLLRSDSSLLPIALRWLLSANGRTIARPELVAQTRDER